MPSHVLCLCSARAFSCARRAVREEPILTKVSVASSRLTLAVQVCTASIFWALTK